MGLNEEEQGLIKEALQVYLQLIGQQMPGALAQVQPIIENIVEKLPNLGESGESTSNKPHNISDEWFENVCQQCGKLTPKGCSDSVTAKFPGKCDPILKYEMQKLNR